MTGKMTWKRTRRAGWQNVEALPCGRWLLGDRWRGGGDVVAIASPRSGRGGRSSFSLSADRSGRSGERLAMVWTVKTSDGAEERRGTGEDGGGIFRPGSLFLFRLLCHISPHEGRERRRGGQDGRPSRLCPGSLSFSSSVPLLFPSLLAFVLSLYIIRYRYNKDNANN